ARTCPHTTLFRSPAAAGRGGVGHDLAGLIGHQDRIDLARIGEVLAPPAHLAERGEHRVPGVEAGAPPAAAGDVVDAGGDEAVPKCDDPVGGDHVQGTELRQFGVGGAHSPYVFPMMSRWTSLVPP